VSEIPIAWRKTITVTCPTTGLKEAVVIAGPNSVDWTTGRFDFVCSCGEHHVMTFQRQDGPD
jgi:hypothetical protein